MSRDALTHKTTSPHRCSPFAKGRTSRRDTTRHPSSTELLLLLLQLMLHALRLWGTALTH